MNKFELIEAIAKENFKRLGENYLCAIKTASMDIKDLLKQALVELFVFDKLKEAHLGEF